MRRTFCAKNRGTGKLVILGRSRVVLKEWLVWSIIRGWGVGVGVAAHEVPAIIGQPNHLDANQHYLTGLERY